MEDMRQYINWRRFVLTELGQTVKLETSATEEADMQDFYRDAYPSTVRSTADMDAYDDAADEATDNPQDEVIDYVVGPHGSEIG